MDRLLKAQAHQQPKVQEFQCHQVRNKNQQFNHPDLPQEPLEPLKPPEQELLLAQLNLENFGLPKDHFLQLKHYAQEHNEGANVELLRAHERGPRASPEPQLPPEPRSGQRVPSSSSLTSPRLAQASRRAPRRTSPS